MEEQLFKDVHNYTKYKLVEMLINNHQCKLKDLIPGTSNQDSYFINFSDGQPWYSNKEIRYCGSEAQYHTKKMCDNMRAKGISVLSYFIGDGYDDSRDNEAFTKMYGKDAEFIVPTNMMSVAKTMNKKFLEK